jgi:tetratricopeptide (TPR) repeat protein
MAKQVHQITAMQDQKVLTRGRRSAAAGASPQEVPNPKSRKSFRRAISLAGQDRLQEAALELIAGLRLEPGYVPGYLELGKLCRRLRQTEAALEAFHSGVRLAPGSGELWREMGITYQSVRMHGEATQSLSAALQIDPADFESRLALGSICLEDGKAGDAFSLFQTAGSWAPKLWRAPCSAGMAARASGRGEEAERLFRNAIELASAETLPWTELGILYKEQRRYEEAKEACQAALRIDPSCVVAWNNLGNLCGELLLLDEADEYYGKALAVDPDYAPSHVARAMLWLLKGRFAVGWQEYQWRWKQEGRQLPNTGRPLWNGDSLKDKTILLVSEQGAGDTIQFIRYARPLQESGAAVWLMCRPELTRLMSTMDAVDRVLTEGDSLEGFDVHCPLLDLPRLLDTGLETIPAWESYLSAPSGIAVNRRAKHSAGKNVGLVWAGNPNHPNDRNRSCRLDEFRHVFPLEDVTVFSFQLGVAAQEIWSNKKFEVVHLGPALEDYAATAANLSLMDAVVTVDTSTAHLAAALGRPVALLLPYSPDWRWLLDRDDSPWYPTLKIFRQEACGDWSAVWPGVRQWLNERMREPEVGR